MTSTIRVPRDLRALTGGERDVVATGETVRDLLSDLDARYPGIAERLLDGSGLRRYVNIYLGGSDIRFARGLDTVVADGVTVTILPAVAGG